MQAFLARLPSASEDSSSEEILILEGEFPKKSLVSLPRAKAAAAYSAEHGGFSFLLMVRGEVIYEQYEGGRKPADPHRFASGTKSFCVDSFVPEKRVRPEFAGFLE